MFQKKRRAFVQSMVASIKNHTGQTNYTDHEISLVLYRQLISGWGFHKVSNTNPTQVIWPLLHLLEFSLRKNGSPKPSTISTTGSTSLSTRTLRFR